MRFMVIVPASTESEAGVMPTEKELADMGAFNEEMAKAGVLLAGEGLQASAKGARVRFAGGAASATKGPFSDAAGLIAGFWLIRVRSLDEAIGWMKRAPFGDGVVLEIRQVAEADDFGEAFTPELREREERLRAQTAARR